MENNNSISHSNDHIIQWSSIIPLENISNVNEVNDYLLVDEQQPVEARAWSTYPINNPENILGEGPTQKQRRIFSSKDQQQEQRKEDVRGVEQILSYIDQRRPRRPKKYRFTWRTCLGTMSGMNQIYSEEDFLQGFEEFRPLIIFLDSIFRGISQVMFVNNPLSGLIITIGLFYANWELTFYGLLGTLISTLTAHLFECDYHSIRAGLFGYNGCLTAMGISYFNFSHSPQLILPVIVMSIFSTIFSMAIGKLLVQRLGLSPFTFSFQISTWIWLLASLKYRYFFLNGTILSPHLLITSMIKPSLANITYPIYSIEDHFIGFFSSISQVYFIANPYTGAIILVGICLCSRILAFFALFGAVTSQLTAAYLLTLSPTSIHAGLWGYNSVLTCQALGGMFFVLDGYRIWLLTFYASIMTVILQSAVSSFLSPIGMPTLTFPFTVICWIFCLIAGSQSLVAVKLTAVSIPEDHYRRFRLSRLVKNQLKFMNHLTLLSSSSHDEDITWEELSKIQKHIVPILMCLYVYQNDLINLKILIKQNNPIHWTDRNLRSPLHISASQGNLKITQWLIENLEIDINSIDQFGGTPLYDALWNGHFHLLAILYSHGARLPSSKGKEMAFYLNGLIFEGNFESIQLILSCGFNPNACDFDGRNALHIAVITNQLNLVCYLVEQFPMWFDLTDYFHQTAIDYALRLSDLTIANYLLDKRDKNHYQPLQISTERSLHLQSFMNKFIANNKDSSQQRAEEEEQSTINIDENLLPILFSMIASQENSADAMTKFLQDNKQFNPIEHVDYDFRSAAHVACVEGRLENLCFLSKQCQPDEFQRMIHREDRWGLSPFDEAFRHGHRNICHFIHEHLHVQSNQEQIIRSNSIETNLIIHLFRKWKKIYLFLTLAASGEVDRIQTLFIRGYFLRTELYADYHGRNPMHFAAANGHWNVIEFLLQSKYEGALHSNRWGYYPIDEARQNKFDHIVHQLTQLQC